MSSNTLSVPFRFSKGTPFLSPAVDLHSDTIVGDLGALGFEFIQLLDVPIKPSIPGQANGQSVRLCVENDAMYLAESYLYLEDIVSLELTFSEHNTFLDDGGLQLQAEIFQSKVSLRIIHCPGLHKSSLSVTEIWVPLPDYLDTWRRLAKALQTGVGETN